jgi:hypothetical protein
MASYDLRGNLGPMSQRSYVKQIIAITVDRQVLNVCASEFLVVERVDIVS